MAALGSVITVALKNGTPPAAFVKALKATSCPRHNTVERTLEVVDGDVVEVENTLPCCISALGTLLESKKGEEPYFELPESGEGKSYHTPAGCGRLDVHATLSDGKVVAVTANTAAPGSCANAISNTIARCITIALNTGTTTAEEIGMRLTGINCPHPTHKCSSCIDGIGKGLLYAAGIKPAGKE